MGGNLQTYSQELISTSSLRASWASLHRAMIHSEIREVVAQSSQGIVTSIAHKSQSTMVAPKQNGGREHAAEVT